MHTFPGPGTYVVTLEVVDGYGLTDRATFTYTAHPGPVADFVHSPSEPLQADSLRLDDRSGGPAPIVGVEVTTTGEPLSSTYEGRTQPVLVGGSATYAMERSGPVRVRWRAFDATLISHAIERDIPIGNAVPEIDVGADQTLVWGQPWAPLEPATLTDLTTEWASLSCAYDFGDGVRAPGPSPCTPTDFYVSHAWADPGTYAVTATVTDPVGGTAEDVFYIEVTPRETGLTLSPVPGAEAGGSRPVAAQLADRFDPATPVAGRTVRFELGAQSVSGVTDATGRASATLDFAAGVPDQRVIATFDGDTHYAASRNEASFPETLRPSYPGNCGTDYVIAFPNPCFDDGSCPAGGRDGEPFYRHSLYFSAESNTNVTVEMPALGATAQVAVEAGSVAQYELPLDAAVQLTASRVNHTLRIRSERIVCVHGLEFNPQGTDGFLALPTNSLGTDYVVASHGGIVRNGFFGPYLTSQLAVVGTADGTTVTITPSDEIASGPATPGSVFEPAGVPFTVTLDEGEVIQLRAYSGNTPAAGDPNRWDLTGTTLSASAPIAVFAGHQCPYVPEGVEACNTLVEQLASTETLGTQYLLTPFPTRDSGYLARVVAAHDGTEVRHDGVLVATLARGAFHEIDIATSVASEIETTQPALVVQLAKGLDAETAPTADRGDPTMLVAVPVEQFDNGALVSTITDSERWSFDHYLNLLAPTAEVGGVRVDGAVVSAAWTSIGTSGWSYAMELVSAGAHRVTHPNPTVAVGVTLSGSAEYDAYAFPARMRLTELAGGCTPSATSPGDGIDNDCDGRLDEELANGLDDDGDGLIDEDLFFETGAAVNLPPFAHDRSDALREDGSKTLVLSGFDPNGDALTYEILSPPSSGTLVGSGNAYLYTPTADFFGADAFTYRVCDGSECSGAATFSVRVIAENDPPLITLGAVYNAIENQLFELPLVASDADATAPLVWSLVSGPSGLAVDDELRLLFWTPDDRFSNTVSPVTVRVTDELGASADYTFGIDVSSRPDAPFIISTPVRVAHHGASYHYDVDAVDPDPFDAVDFQILAGPPGMTLDATTGVLTWAPTLSDAGTHDVEVVARDSIGLLSEPQRFVLEVRGDGRPPEVTVDAYPEPIVPGQTTTLTVTAVDDDDAAITGLDVEGTPITLAADGTGTWTPASPGRYTATASAVDPSGNTGTARFEIRVLDASDAAAPFVELTAPAADSVLTYLHDAIGTVRDDNLLRWWLDMRPTDGGTYRTLLSGTSGVEAASLGQLDTTQLRNGTYFLRLRAEDINGRVSQAEHTVRVEGGAKVGVVRLELTDIVMPDFGIPIAVNRVYDSRLVPDRGDFGVGWQLDIRQGSIQHNHPLAEGIAIYTSEGDMIPCQRVEDQIGHYTEVRLSDDEWYLFQPTIPDPGVISGGCGGHVNYDQVDGTRPNATLTPIGENLVRASAIEVVRAGAFARESNIRSVVDDQPYTPQDFRLALADGRVFDINVSRGITRVEDRNGNYLQINEESIVHSSGRGMVFVRDARGRIIQVMDAAGRSTGYEYDASGNLTAFIDVAGRRTTYEYGEPAYPHHLTGILDWRGVRVAAMDYQADGRLRELCDADGICLESQYDLAARSMIRFDGIRRPTRYSYDERGNVVGVADGLGWLTQYRYDVYDNLIRRIDADGAITRYGYDLFTGLMTSQIEPHEETESAADFTTAYTYTDRFDLETHTLPTGGTYHYEYDANGNQTFARDDAGNVLFARTFNADGTLATFTDRFGTTTYGYTQGLPTTVTEPDGAITELAYDAFGNVTRVTRDGVTQRFRYDAAGRPTFRDYGGGATVRFEYSGSHAWSAIEGPTFGRVERTLSAAGNLLSWVEPNGDTGSRTYDASGQLRLERDAQGHATRYEYDAAGHLERIIDEARGATTVMTHDPVGRVLTRTDPLGHVSTMTYDVRGAMATRTDARTHTTTFAQTPGSSSHTNPLGHTTTSARTSYGLPGATTYPGGHSTSTTYLGDTALDASTQFPLTQVDESSRTRTFGYDARSVLQTATDLGGNAWTYGHTRVMAGDVTWDVQSGEVAVAVDGARAPVTRYSYRDQARDGHRPEALDGWVDRLSQVTSPGGEVTTWTFGPGGEIARVDYPFGGALTRTFDAAQRVASETRPFGTTLTFARDAAGRVTGRTGSDGSAQSRTYLPGDRTDTVTDATGTTTYLYEAAGRFAGLDQPSGAGIAYGRDALDQVTSVTVHGDAAVDTRTFESAYSYDPNGNLSTVTDPFGRVTTYTYDAADRLTVITLPNGVTSTYGYDDRDRVTSLVHAESSGAVLASVAYTRAPSGEPTRITREDGSYVTVGYDAALRVEQESYHDASDVLVEEISYTYDADGNRTSRTTAGATDTYVYGSGSRLLRVERGGSPTQTFTYDGGGRVTRIERDGRDCGLTYDADDHVVELEDASTGVGARMARAARPAGSSRQSKPRSRWSACRTPPSTTSTPPESGSCASSRAGASLAHVTCIAWCVCGALSTTLPVRNTASATR